MKKWSVSELDKDMVRKLSSAYGIPVFTAMLLTIRNITSREDIESFFSQSGELDDPFLIKDMDKAVERIKKAIYDNEKICIYGDYDCDGVTSTAILYHYLESCAAEVMYYIPDRNEEGYGMNMAAVDKLSDMGVGLIITVDNGISAIDEISHAKELGMDVVVTDHHKPLEILPAAAAVFTPAAPALLPVAAASTPLPALLPTDARLLPGIWLPADARLLPGTPWPPAAPALICCIPPSAIFATFGEEACAAFGEDMCAAFGEDICVAFGVIPASPPAMALPEDVPAASPPPIDGTGMLPFSCVTMFCAIL